MDAQPRRTRQGSGADGRGQPSRRGCRLDRRHAAAGRCGAPQRCRGTRRRFPVRSASTIGGSDIHRARRPEQRVRRSFTPKARQDARVVDDDGGHGHVDGQASPRTPRAAGNTPASRKPHAEPRRAALDGPERRGPGRGRPHQWGGVDTQDRPAPRPTAYRVNPASTSYCPAGAPRTPARPSQWNGRPQTGRRAEDDTPRVRGGCPERCRRRRKHAPRRGPAGRQTAETLLHCTRHNNRGLGPASGLPLNTRPIRGIGGNPTVPVCAVVVATGPATIWVRGPDSNGWSRPMAAPPPSGPRRENPPATDGRQQRPPQPRTLNPEG